MNTLHAEMNAALDDLVEARRQLVSMCRKLEASLQTLRDKAVEGRRLKPQITLAECRIQALHVALRCLDNAIRQGEGRALPPDGESR